MDADSEFQQQLVDYLESVHVGEFLMGKHADVAYKKDINSVDRSYKDPTQVLPLPPPLRCTIKDCKECSQCKATQNWWIHYKNMVDDLLVRSNVHRCSGGIEDHGDEAGSGKTGKKTKTDKKTIVQTPLQAVKAISGVHAKLGFPGS